MATIIYFRHLFWNYWDDISQTWLEGSLVGSLSNRSTYLQILLLLQKIEISTLSISSQTSEPNLDRKGHFWFSLKIWSGRPVHLKMATVIQSRNIWKYLWLHLLLKWANINQSVYSDELLNKYSGFSVKFVILLNFCKYDVQFFMSFVSFYFVVQIAMTTSW